MADNTEVHPSDMRVVRFERRIDRPRPEGVIIFDYPAKGGRRGTVSISADYCDDPVKVLRELRRELADLPRDRTQALAVVDEVLAAGVDAPVFELTSRTGWYDESFVLPGKTFGPKRDTLRFSPPVGGVCGRDRDAGTLEGWRNGLRRSCAASSILTFAIAAAFSAPLASDAELSEGAIFMLAGASGTGKTTAQRAAMSVYGASDITLMPTFDATGRALEELCSSFNDTLVVLDEVNRAGRTRKAREEKLSEIAYKVPGGVGRLRAASVSEQGLANLSWRVTVLCTAEESFYGGEGGDSRRTGERVRLVEIPVPKPDLGGIFPASYLDPGERLARGRELTEAVDSIIRVHYGKAIQRFIRGLVKYGEVELKGEIRRLMAEFTMELLDRDEPFAARLASKFALVCAGGRLAARLKVAPFDEERCVKACRHLFGMSLRAMMPKPPMTVERYAKALRRLLRDPGRLPVVEEGQCLPSDVREPIGVVRKVGVDRVILIRKDDLRRVVDAPIGMALLDEFARVGALVIGGDGNRTIQVKVSGWPAAGRLRWFAFKVERIEKLAKGRPATV